MISVDLNIKTPKLQEKITTSRDFRKLKRNPEVFRKELRNVKWEVLGNMEDVDPMEEFWTKKINECMDIVAPWKSRKIKQKRYRLPKETQSAIKIRNDLKKKLQINVKNGIEDLKLEEQSEDQEQETIAYPETIITNPTRPNNPNPLTNKQMIIKTIPTKESQL